MLCRKCGGFVKLRCKTVHLLTKQWGGTRRQCKQLATDECLPDEIMVADGYRCPRAKLGPDYVARRYLCSRSPPPNSPLRCHSRRCSAPSAVYTSTHAKLFVSANKFQSRWRRVQKVDRLFRVRKEIIPNGLDILFTKPSTTLGGKFRAFRVSWFEIVATEGSYFVRVCFEEFGEFF